MANTKTEMTEHEFKDGEWAWSPFDGWAKCKLKNNGVEYIDHGGFVYWRDGRWSGSDKYPTLFTVEQAAKLGHVPPSEGNK